MSKKSRKNKQVTALRREVEALRQITGSDQKVDVVFAPRNKEVTANYQKAQSGKENALEFDAQHLGADLQKTAILTGVSLLILSLLTRTQASWPQYVLALSQKIVKLPFYQ